MLLSQSKDIQDTVSFDKDDLLGRKSFSESLNNLIKNSMNESLVISINAKWGEGKTHFLKSWRNMLEANSTNVIYFDSFKNDYIEDPFIPLLGEIINCFKEDKSNILDKGKNIIKGLVPLLGKIGGRIALGGDIESIDDKLEKLIEGDLVSQIGKTLEKYTTKENDIKIFKDTIEAIIKEKGPLIFIIDELDRCRPDFALRLLERIKHFFDIKGLYFILGINREQIEEYIKVIYGNIDSSIYLQKFIDVETVLPKLQKYGEFAYKDFVKKKINEHRDLFIEKDDGALIERIELIFNFFGKNHFLSLREIEKILNYFITARKVTEKNHFFMSNSIFLIIYLKVKNIDLYTKFRENNITKEDFLEAIHFDKLPNGDRYALKKKLSEEIDFIFDDELSEGLRRRYSYVENTFHFDLSKDGRLKVLAYHFDILENYCISN